jgi:beta-lactam-binding protein with PASTA domain
MPLASGLWSVGRILLLLAALGLTFAGSAVLGLRLGLRAREVPVPDLIGQTVEIATARLAADGLALRLDASRREHPGVSPDRIAQQDPAPGVSTRRPRAVRVWLKAPARATRIPDFTGGTDRTARIRADQSGIRVDSPAAVPDDRPAGTVIAQWPPVGAAAAPADAVRLVVSAGPWAWPVLMPDFTGEDATPVAARLKAAGLRVLLTDRRRPAGVQAGVIAAQLPLPGAPAAVTDTITLEVYR